MLTDHWIIAQLLAQTCALALLLSASRSAVPILARWDGASSSTSQLMLERRTYLVASIVQFALAFQILSLLMFLVTVNEHIPNLIKGAMCAQGALGVNDWGYPLLYLKMGGIFVYVGYLVLHYLDDSEPDFPLTPAKYWLIFPSLLLTLADLLLMFFYFGGIEPDIIATCCSVSFIGLQQNAPIGTVGGMGNGLYFVLFFASFAALQLVFWLGRQIPWLQFLFAGLFTYFAIFSLKSFFVKYIYGLPSHLCLFDIFFGQYHYVGYLIFGGYYFLMVSLLVRSIYAFSRGRLGRNHPKLWKGSYYIALAASWVSFLTPVLYWLAWRGNL